MPTMKHVAPLVPKAVKIKFVRRRNDWLSLLLLKERWSPFEAACILLGFRPEDIDSVTENAEASWVTDPEDHEEFPANFDDAADYGRELRDLTKTIASNASIQGGIDVIPSEIVAWAIENGSLSTESELAVIFERRRLAKLEVERSTSSTRNSPTASEKLAQELDQAKSEICCLTNERDKALEEISRLKVDCVALKKKAKHTGKQHAATREKILTAALYHLANYRDECVEKNNKDKVVAAKLGGELHDKRVNYGFGIEDENPSASTIIDLITGALSNKIYTTTKI